MLVKCWVSFQEIEFVLFQKASNSESSNGKIDKINEVQSSMIEQSRNYLYDERNE